MARSRTASAALGIGIINYNWIEALTDSVQAVPQYTTTPYQPVVADDGSEDGSDEWARPQGFLLITGQHRRPAWNRNRAAFCLVEQTECDSILLLEDDSWPAEVGLGSCLGRSSPLVGHLSRILTFIVLGKANARDK